MMAWLTHLRTYLGYDEPLISGLHDDGTEEARKALRRASSALNEAQHRREEVRAVTKDLAQLRARNHFGESIELAMMRKEKDK
jgi:hypothetical protein